MSNRPRLFKNHIGLAFEILNTIISNFKDNLVILIGVRDIFDTNRKTMSFTREKVRRWYKQWMRMLLMSKGLDYLTESVSYRLQYQPLDVVGCGVRN